MKLAKKTLYLWQIRSISFALILSGLLHFFFAELLLTLTVLGIFLAITFIYLPLLHKSYKIDFEGDNIAVSFGVIIHFAKKMPKRNLVFAERISTPLSRRLSLNAVIFKAARGYLFVPEIDKNTEIPIKEHSDG